MHIPLTNCSKYTKLVFYCIFIVFLLVFVRKLIIEAMDQKTIVFVLGWINECETLAVYWWYSGYLLHETALPDG